VKNKSFEYITAVNLGQALRERRTERGMSLREFSEYLSISHAYLNKLEKGFDPHTGRPVAPTIEVLTKISNGLELPLDELLSECGYIAPGVSNRSPASLLELHTLAAEFVSAVTDARMVTRGGEPINGGKEELLRAAVDTLIDYVNSKVD